MSSPQAFTASFLKSRGFCCESNCLHCPYGYTIKNLGFDFRKVEKKEVERAQKIISPDKEQSFDVANFFLEQAYGKKPSQESIHAGNFQFYHFVFLKDQLCGVIRAYRKEVKELYLLESFQDQGIDLALVNSYF